MNKIYQYKNHTIIKTNFKRRTIKRCFDNFYSSWAWLYVVRGALINHHVIFGCTSIDQCKEEINEAIRGAK
tara:strand:+ start:275 stop:487 length:213 start_codon:yes stop_codon:yes gene_type:complete